MNQVLIRLSHLFIIVAVLSAIATYLGPLPDYFIWIDMGVIITFAALILLKNVISIRTKITVSIVICYFIAIISYLNGGFNSAGTLLLLLGNILTVLFLERIYSMKRFLMSSIDDLEKMLKILRT